LPVDEMNKVQIQFIRPSAGTFRAWGEIATDTPCPSVSSGCYIPNNNLLGSDPTDTRSDPDDLTGTAPLINIQDANLMTISIRYLIDTGVPFMNGFFLGEPGPTNMEDLAPGTFVDDPFNRARNRPGVWVTAESTMLMQTNATISVENICAIGGYC
ncbi:MAG: hypothetical protein MI976_10115, partial [Pseudomonadales bacterium]|nr:hypothetical protein [Pseudomonadales bacterium]